MSLPATRPMSGRSPRRAARRLGDLADAGGGAGAGLLRRGEVRRVVAAILGEVSALGTG